MKFYTVTLALAATFATVSASAAPAQPCVNDIDCTGGGKTCGGDVCQWPGMTCMPAGSMAAGSDGWCGQDSDCKCHSLGATCLATNGGANYCTFTTPPDAGTPGDAGVGADGGTGDASEPPSDSGAATGGDAGGPVGVSTDAGPTANNATSSSGCSVGPHGTRPGAFGALALLATVMLRRRRRQP